MQKHKYGDAIEVGDLIKFGNTFHRVDEIRDYQHPTLDGPFRIASSDDGWSITLDTLVNFEVA